MAILGGAKVSDKIGVLKNLMTKVDAILIGGAMAYTFLKAQGIAVGKSRVEEDKLELAREILAAAAARNVRFILPCDHVFAEAPEAERPRRNRRAAFLPTRWGSISVRETIQQFIAELNGAKTVVWNGPLGLFEIPAFAAGTLAVGVALADSGAKSVIGGGDTAAAVAGPRLGQAIHPYIDRRRRDAGVSRRIGAARSQGARALTPGR